MLDRGSGPLHVYFRLLFSNAKLKAHCSSTLQASNAFARATTKHNAKRYAQTRVFKLYVLEVHTTIVIYSFGTVM